VAKASFTAWHKVVRLRDDLRTGELSLAQFAADLYDVFMGKAKPIYQDPQEFFSLTYPTFNLRELVKDVLLRLAGKNDKAVRQLELTYGGGKTHTLITLFHLVSDPANLPDLPAVKEFIEHAGVKPPRSRVVVLPFDKLDVERGMEVKGPRGKSRWLKHPWSLLAFQIAGAEGLKRLHADGKDAERDTPPAENLLRDLIAFPLAEGQGTLILIDEVLMFAREKIGLDPVWRHRLVDFFQYLTQAVTKVDRAAIVASLLATDPRKSDTLGKQITQELYAVFRREREEGVQPVVKDDVAEVLRRRFFTPESIRDREAFRPHVVAALQGVKDLDETTRKDSKAAEDRFLKSYPFHPDITDVFYGKWTNLEGFQRTRGILRTFAMSLRDAEKWDTSPVMGPMAFLTSEEGTGLSEAARELASIAATEEYEGKRQEWGGILEGELDKAKAIQAENAGLRHREIEQAVFAIFLHSQPIGQKAHTRDLFVLLGPGRPDRIELEKGLRRWTEISWFLDEGTMVEAEESAASAGAKELPKAWRLGSKPNLRQMHNDACLRVSPDLIEAKLRDEIARLKNLTTGAAAAGARVHNLPAKPSDIEDDGEFHYAVLGPKAASESGKPGAEAKRFIEETTGPDRPRVHRNAVVLAVPSRDGLDIARSRIRDYLGWEEITGFPEAKHFDELRKSLLTVYLDQAKKRIPEAIAQAYCIVVSVSASNEVQAFKVTVGPDPLFTTIKNDPRARIQDTPVSADALLPGGPYDLWREGETARRVKDLVGAFAQFPHLPKMLRRKEILDTLSLGAREGFFVLRLTRPDKSVRTLWRQDPTEEDLKDPSLEAVLPEAAELSELSGSLLAPGMLPGLRPTGTTEIAVASCVAFFDGTRTIRTPCEGYEETVRVPKADRRVVDLAVRNAVKEGKLWLTAGPASLFKEDIPAGILTDAAMLNPPPEDILPTDILPPGLPDAWAERETTAAAITTILSQRRGKILPWVTVREAIDAAFRARMLERTLDSGLWPCDWPGASAVKVRVPTEVPLAPPPLPPRPGVLTAEAELKTGELQDLADEIASIVSAAAGLRLRFVIRVEVTSTPPPTPEILSRINEALAKVSDKLKLE